MSEEETADIKELWAEHQSSPFPAALGGKDVNGIDFDMLDSDIRGCVMWYLEQGILDVRRTAILGLCYYHCEFIVPILSEEAADYYWRAGRLAERILRQIAGYPALEVPGYSSA